MNFATLIFDSLYDIIWLIALKKHPALMSCMNDDLTFTLDKSSKIPIEKSFHQYQLVKFNTIQSRRHSEQINSFISYYQHTLLPSANLWHPFLDNSA